MTAGWLHDDNVGAEVTEQFARIATRSLASSTTRTPSRIALMGSGCTSEVSWAMSDHPLGAELGDLVVGETKQLPVHVVVVGPEAGPTVSDGPVRFR